LEIVFSHWIARVRWILEHNGDYDHNQINHQQKDVLVRFLERWRHYLLIPQDYVPTRPLYSQSTLSTGRCSIEAADEEQGNLD
jgi:hypothetical protein